MPSCGFVCKDTYPEVRTAQLHSICGERLEGRYAVNSQFTCGIVCVVLQRATCGDTNVYQDGNQPQRCGAGRVPNPAMVNASPPSRRLCCMVRSSVHVCQFWLWGGAHHMYTIRAYLPTMTCCHGSIILVSADTAMFCINYQQPIDCTDR
jgi:hypothetical protein